MIEAMIINALVSGGGSDTQSVSTSVSGGGSDTNGGATPVSDGGQVGGMDISGIIAQFEGLFSGISCWGSSWTPQKAESKLNTVVPPMLAKLEALAQSADENSASEVNGVILNYKKDYQHATAWHQSPTNPTTGCTKKTLDKMLPALDSAYEAGLGAFKAKMKQRGYTVKIKGSTFSYTSANTFSLPIKTVEITKIANFVPSASELLTSTKSVNSFSWLVLAGLGFAGYKGAAYVYDEYVDNKSAKKFSKSSKLVKW